MIAPGKRSAGDGDAATVKKVKFDESATKKPTTDSRGNKNFVKGGKFTGGKFSGGKNNNGKFSGGKFNGGKFNGGKFSGNKFSGNKFNGNKKPDSFIKTENGKATNGDNNQKPAEKPDWNKFKQDKKNLKLKRKGTKDSFEVTVAAKKIYEQLNCKTVANKEELCQQLHALILKGDNYERMVLAHDSARIVQCLLKKSPGGIKREISEKLIPIFDKMATSKYAHFCASRLIQYGTPDIKSKAIDAILGNVIKLVYHAHGSSIIDNIYVSWASSQQKACMRQEFYGDLYKKSKDLNVKCIADTYKDAEHMKLAVLNAVKAHLNHLANKKLVDNSLVHAVLLDYLNLCNEEDRNEIITAYSPYIPSLASTKDGTRASIICFWNSIVKDRRAIVKTIREHLIKICTHEHGYVLILAIVNSMDDTKALKKAIFDHLFTEIDTLMSNEYGRRVIEWFVSPGDTAAFHPQITAVLEEGLKNSKKDKEVRRLELLDAVEEPLCGAIAANPALWLKSGKVGLATAALLKNFRGEHLKKAYDSLAALVCTNDWKVPVKDVDEVNANTCEVAKESTKIKKKKIFVGNETEQAVKEPEELILGIEHAGLHVVLKKLLKNGKENEVKFSAALADHLTEETIENWFPLNRASFLILNAYENASETTQSTLKALVSKKIAILKKQKHAASKLLLKNLALK